jgi:hypothetical protein
MDSFQSISAPSNRVVTPDPLCIGKDIRDLLTPFLSDGTRGITENDFKVLKGPLERSLIAWTELGKFPNEVQNGMYNMAAILWVSRRTVSLHKNVRKRLNVSFYAEQLCWGHG